MLPRFTEKGAPGAPGPPGVTGAPGSLGVLRDPVAQPPSCFSKR